MSPDDEPQAHYESELGFTGLRIQRSAVAAILVHPRRRLRGYSPRQDGDRGVGGAYLGHEFSAGDPLPTAAGTADGVVVSETLHCAAKKLSAKVCAIGYNEGKSDAKPLRLVE